MAILLVDDDPRVLRAVERALGTFDLSTAKTSTEALALLATRPFNAIVVDYGLAPADGVSVLREVAATYPAVRRYMISGFERKRFDEHIASNLVRYFFRKPLDLNELRSELGTVGLHARPI